MATNTTVLIVVTGVAILALVVVIVGVTYKTRSPRRRATDATIRDETDNGALPRRRQPVGIIGIDTIRASDRDTNPVPTATKRPPPAIN